MGEHWGIVISQGGGSKVRNTTEYADPFAIMGLVIENCEAIFGPDES